MAIDMVECTVAPGGIVYAGQPDASGTVPQVLQPGATFPTTQEEAARLREAGHVLMADGTKRISAV